jgi:UrcA family protein
MTDRKKGFEMLKSTGLAALIALGACAVATPSFANDTAKVLVKTTDLDLTDAKDRARLDRRIKKAARSICGGNGSRSLNDKNLQNMCVESIVDRTQADVRLALAKAQRRQALMVVAQPSNRAKG